MLCIETSNGGEGIIAICYTLVNATIHGPPLSQPVCNVRRRLRWGLLMAGFCLGRKRYIAEEPRDIQSKQKVTDLMNTDILLQNDYKIKKDHDQVLHPKLFPDFNDDTHKNQS